MFQTENVKKKNAKIFRERAKFLKTFAFSTEKIRKSYNMKIILIITLSFPLDHIWPTRINQPDVRDAYLVLRNRLVRKRLRTWLAGPQGSFHKGKYLQDFGHVGFQLGQKRKMKVKVSGHGITYVHENRFPRAETIWKNTINP